MEKITAPISAIVVAIIITLGFLVGTGALMPEAKTYATVKFDGGFKKIGVISSEEIFTKAIVELNDSVIYTNDFADTIAWIKKNSKDKGISNTTWKNGVELKATAGIRWIGSESSFNLTTEDLTLKSTDEKPLVAAEVITQLEALERKAKANRTTNAKEALEFSAAPHQSFLLSKMLSAFSK